MYTRIDPKQHIVHGTRLHFLIACMLAVLSAPAAFFLPFVGFPGGVVLAGIVFLVIHLSRVPRARAQLRGSAVRVGPSQFPEIHEAAVNMAAGLGLRECPCVYICEYNEQNAFAVKYGSKQYVVLFDEIVHGMLETGNVKALHFLIAHELAHHALGHTGLFYNMMAGMYRPLSRLDEFSADAVAHALVGSLSAARDAFTLLLIGPQLFGQIDREALNEQAREVVADRHSRASESGSTHPLTLRRYARLWGMSVAS